MILYKVYLLLLWKREWRNELSSITTNLNNLKERDIYSLLLFCLYKLSDIPEYSSLSELVYVMDKQNFLNFCEYFGGQTIKVPTIDELNALMYSLLLYQYVKIDKVPYEKALTLIGHESKELRAVKKNYRVLCDILQKYSITPREDG